MKDGTFTADRLLALYDSVADAEDAIPRLRRFVLDLAVRGKLVEQDPADEPAAELLKRIAKEKARLVKAGEIKDPKPIALNGEPVAPAPMGWVVVPLGEVTNRHLGGGTPSKNDHSYWGGDIRWASVKDVGKTKYVDDTIDRITQKGLENSSSNLVPAGNLIVVTRMGLGQLSINRVPVAINQDLRALFLSSFLDIDFVYNFFLTYGMEGTGLTVKGIKIEELLGIPFPLPPLAEQQRIVAKVNELMALCDQLEAARAGREAVRDRLTAATWARLTAPETDAQTFPTHARAALQTLPTLTTRPDQIKTLRQTILNLAVRGKLVAQDPTDEPAAELVKRIVKEKAEALKRGGERRSNIASEPDGTDLPFSIPVTWQWIPATFPAVGVSDVGKKIQTKDVKENGAFPVVDQGRIAIRGFCNDAEKVIKVEVPLILFGDHTRETKYLDFDFVVGADGVKLLRPIGIFDRYYFLSLQWLPLESRGYGRHFKMLKASHLPLPPLAEQHRIVAKVDALMTLCDQLEASLTTARTTRSQLLEATLHAALAGGSQAA